MGFAEEYTALYEGSLSKIVPTLEGHLRGVVSGVPRIDRITARAKSPDRFIAKANKLSKSGQPKYSDPLSEIQDQIGARITVFYLFDVEAVREAVLRYLRPIEFQVKEPTGDSEFGYFGEHFILRIPDDAIPEDASDNCPEFFELQIKTLFQHAWSEADHDLGYKSFRGLKKDEKRKVAFTAAQAWGADQIFAELGQTLVLGESKVGGADSEDA